MEKIKNSPVGAGEFMEKNLPFELVNLVEIAWFVEELNAFRNNYTPDFEKILYNCVTAYETINNVKV